MAECLEHAWLIAGIRAQWSSLWIPPGVADAIQPSPLVLACAASTPSTCFCWSIVGLRPYVAVFLAEEKWTQQNIDFVLTAGGFAGLLSQLRGGELLDAIRSKRLAVTPGGVMVATGALIIAVRLGY